MRMIANCKSTTNSDKRAATAKHRESQRLVQLKHKYFSIRTSVIKTHAPYINDIFDTANAQPFQKDKAKGTKEILLNLFKKDNYEGAEYELNLNAPMFQEARTRYYICLHIW